jgi:glycosyltransferase involved in cell wall biosynthesis
MRQAVLNGKFLAQARTGVQRVASEFACALDGLASAGGDAREPQLSLVYPHNARLDIQLHNIPHSPVGRLKGVPWEQLELPRHVGRNLLVSLCNAAPLSRRGDIVFIHDAQAFSSPQSYSRAFRTWYQTILPILGRRAGQVVTVSSYARDDLVRFGIAAEEKISVVHNGVDHVQRIVPDETILDNLKLRDCPYVVAPGNTQSHKNIPLLFQAFREPVLAGVKLVLIGPATAEDFQRIGAEPPAGALFAGRVPDPQMRALIEHAGAFAFPSTTEGFGLPPLEAMLLGTPAVVAPLGALPELCGDAVLYAAADDAAAWASALAKLVGEPSFRLSQSRLGQAQAGRYRWTDSAGKLSALIRDRL